MPGRHDASQPLSVWPGEGSEPKGGVIQASDGLFYGTTEQGGYRRRDLHYGRNRRFHRPPPLRRLRERRLEAGERLDRGPDGFFYRTAPVGGLPVTGSRYGVVYRVDKAGTVTVLHTFIVPDGIQPTAALVQGADGALDAEQHAEPERAPDDRRAILT